MSDEIFDIAIIGGGINGSGIARDAAGRGLKVLLVDKGDLGSGTSSQSTKLIHGGLRYLEQKQFRLVRESLVERDILLRSAPHIIWPMRFILPYDDSKRPFWQASLGLFLYDMMGSGKLPTSRSLNLKKHKFGDYLVESLRKKSFIYSDCWVQDSRLVILNCMDAKQRGAKVMPRTACMSVKRNKDTNEWEIMLRGQDNGKTTQVKSKFLVNATGPWVNITEQHVLNMSGSKKLRLIKGSHIVVPKLFDHAYAYIFQHSDGRVIFALPFEEKFTLIGTTEEEFSGDPSNAKISDAEINYLCSAVNKYFKKNISAPDIKWSYSGVRPLVDDNNNPNPSEISREYVLENDKKYSNLLHVYGGKITTHRKLAETAMSKMGYHSKAWTKHSTLPGGDFKNGNFKNFHNNLKELMPWLPADLLFRYARNYGTNIERIIGKAKDLKDLGQNLGDNIYEAELDYLIRFEWAHTVEDVLLRRTKMHLHVSPETRNNLQQWLEKNAST